MLSDLSVRRPVFAAVMAIILCVVGLASFRSLPVRELPSVDPPIVGINVTYTGASSEVVEERITQVLERQVSGIQGIDRITSSSRDGQSRITIQFTLDRDLDAAANDVRDAVARASNQLPIQADPAQITKANADAAPIMILNLSSTQLTRLQLADYADRYLVERLGTVPGVAQVGIGGGQLYAMRVWLDPDAMAARGITVDDVQAALNSQNLELPAGSLESQRTDFTIRVNRGYARAQDFAALPVRPTGAGAGASTAATASAANSQVSSSPNTGAAPTAGAASTPDIAYVTRLGDIARIEEGPNERRSAFRGNGNDQVGLAVSRQSQANDLQISAGVRAAVADINRTLPPATHLVVAIDNSVFTAQAIHEVWSTMAISIGLVALVNFLFLGSWRSALIPSIVAPICILSSFIVLAPLGFSVNLLTLLALVLAVGLVVDDAIVVVENIQRRIDEGEPPAVAAMRGARQVFFAVIATTMVLVAVFGPLMFLPGFTGRLFVELAVAVASAIIFSAVLALSLSPMLASKLLRPASSEGWLAGKVDYAVTKVRNSYRNSLNMILGTRLAPIIAGALVVVLGAMAMGLYLYLPKEQVPAEDRGRVDVSITAPEGTGYDYTYAAALQVEQILRHYQQEGTADRYMVTIPQFGGGSASFNTASAVVALRPWGQRRKTADQVAQELNRSLSRITSVRAIATVRSPLQRGPGSQGGANSVDFIAVGNDYDQIISWLQPIMTAEQNNPGFSRVRLNYEPTAPRLTVNIDRERAASLGISAQSIGSALQTMFGSARVTTYLRQGQEYDVILQTDRAHRTTVQDLNSLYVRTNTGGLVPLSTVVTTQVRGDSPDRPRVDRSRAVTLTAQLSQGFTIGDAVTFLRAQAAAHPSSTVSYTWGGQTKDFLESGSSVGVAFGLALLLVFLVLAAQFESWIHPAVIMLTVPLAALGGLFGLLIAGSSLNTYSQIGLIILIGIAAKNGILIVEFSNQLRDEGLSIREAVMEAAALRLRPIVMTSITAAFGSLPLVLANGAGAGSRQTIGVVIFSGAIFVTLLTLFVVPVFYNLLARFTKSPEHTARQIEAFEEQENVRAANAAE